MATLVKTDVRKRVKKYIDTADDTTVQMIYAMLKVQKTQAKEKYEADEIERRIEEYEQGKILPITVTIQQLANGAREEFKKRNLQA